MIVKMFFISLLSFFVHLSGLSFIGSVTSHLCTEENTHNERRVLRYQLKKISRVIVGGF